MRALIAVAVFPLLAACAAVDRIPDSGPGGHIFLLPPGPPATERVRATELAADLEGGRFGATHP